MAQQHTKARLLIVGIDAVAARFDILLNPVQNADENTVRVQRLLG